MEMGTVGLLSQHKQLIEVLYCNLQVTIHKGLVEVQADILEAIANFVANFHIEVIILSAPQVCALLYHMHGRQAGSHSFLEARVFLVEWSYSVASTLL